MAFIDDEEVPGWEGGGGGGGGEGEGGGREGGKTEGGFVPEEDLVRGEDNDGGEGGEGGGGRGGRGKSTSTIILPFSSTTGRATKVLFHHFFEGYFPRFLLPSMRVHFD